MNPFDGVSPDWGAFAAIGNIARAGLAIAWAAAFSYTAVRLVIAGAKLTRARGRGYANDAEEGLTDAKLVIASVVTLAGAPLIFQAVLDLVQQSGGGQHA